jgi:NAD(P) transhydrogenase subunit alpha
MSTIGVLKEFSHDSRVSLIPETVKLLIQKGHQIIVEQDCGSRAFYSNDAYQQAGASVLDRDAILQQSDILLSIHAITPAEAQQLKPGALMIGVYQPLFQFKLMQAYAALPISVFSLDALPRTTRAQAMDVLSSQANIAGYKAVLLAATAYPRYFPMFMTAAGSIAPAKVLILGAGVAGLQAIATAKRLGAVVEVFDTRPAVKEEVMSLGAKFIEVEGAADASQAGGYAVEQSDAFKLKQKEKIAAHVAKADIIITTAQIPGKTAPILITKAMLESMRAGSIIIDLAAATGGNTELTLNNETVMHNDVQIIGDSQLQNKAPADASKMYSKNVQTFLNLFLNENGNIDLNFDDDLIKGACILHQKEIVHHATQNLITQQMHT